MTIAPIRTTGATHRIHFGAEDLARVQVFATLGPIAEAVFALSVLVRRGNPVFSGWQRQVQADLGPTAELVRRVASSLDPVTDLLWLLERRDPPSERRLAEAGLTRQQVTTAVRELCQRGVVPYWRNVLGHLECERDARGRLLMSGGIEQLFGVLGPGITWRPPVLEIPSDTDQSCELDGRGLLLVPSVFLFRRQAVLVRAQGTGQRPVLVFPAAPDPGSAPALWARSRISEPLDALVGRTRARLLRQTTVSCTTTELAEQLGVSAASISQHTRVLREAGLITTFRHRNRVLHSITALGTAMLAGRPRASSLVV